jgi:NADPH2 dehydrogenase
MLLKLSLGVFPLQQLRALNIGFLGLIDACIRENDYTDCGEDNDLSFAVHAWGKEAPVMAGGGLNSQSAQKAVDKTYKNYKLAVMFGLQWTRNPDLPFRIKQNIPLVKYDRPTFYTPKKSKDYNDWEFRDEFLGSSTDTD